MNALSPRYKWQVVAMLWWIAFFNYADRQAIFSVFPLLAGEMHLNRVQLGMLGSSFALVYAIAAPLAGSLIDRIRRKTAILSGLQIWSFICVATAISRNFTQLLFFRAAEGLGETVYFPASMSLISDYHGKRTRSRAMGTHQTSVYIGTIAGGFFAGLIAKHYGWRASFVIFGVCGMLLGLVLHKLLLEPRRGAADLADLGADAAAVKPVRIPLPAFFRMILGRPTILLLMGAFMCENFTAMVIFTWMPTFLYEKYSMDLAMAGLTATLYIQLASMAGSPLGGWMADSLRARLPGGRILVQAFGIFWEAPLAIFCALTGNLSWLIAGLVAWGIFKGFYEANIFASIFDVIRPEARGTATGVMNMVGWLAGGASPVIVGWLSESYGLSKAIAAAGLLYWVASLLLFIAGFGFARRDSERLAAELAAEAALASE